MKKFFTLLLLSPLIVSEEIEYPIELTCEAGTDIYFVSIQQNDSWIETRNVLGLVKRNQNKRFEAKVEVDDETIYVSAGRPVMADQITLAINRYTLGFDLIIRTEGQCYKGLKVYSEKQI